MTNSLAPRTVKTSTELYPPPCTAAFWNMLVAISTGDRDDRGNLVLRRSLRPYERSAMIERARQLSQWVQPATDGKIAEAVATMLIGFGTKSSTKTEARVVATQYVLVLRGLPLWCVERACHRFATAAVKPEELGTERIDWSFPPSTAQLRIVAAALAKDFRSEYTRIGMTLRGSVAPEISAAERAEVKAKITAFAEQFGAMVRGRDAGSAEIIGKRRQEQAAERAAANRAALVAEYDAIGVQPVEIGGEVVSLSLLRSQGWRVEEEVDGRNVLTR